MEQKIQISDFVDFFVNERGLKREDAKIFLKAFFDVVDENLARDKYVKIRGLGTFKLVVVDARESVNVNTGERIEIGQHAKVSFTPDTSLKNLINRPFADFETVILDDGVDLSGVDDSFVEIEESNDSVEPSVNESQEEAPAENVIVFDLSSSDEKETAEAPAPETVAAEEQSDKKAEQADEEKEPSLPEDFSSLQNEKPSLQNEKSFDENEERSGFLARNSKTIVSAIVVIAIILVSYYAGSNNFFGCSEKTENLQAQRIDQVRANDSIARLEAEKARKADSIAAVYARQKEAERAEIEANEKAKQKALEEKAAKEEKKAKEEKNIKEDKPKKKLPKGVLAYHTLKRGESLRSIAKQYYGDKKYYTAIVRYNGVKDPDHVEVGMKLTIPDIKK